MDWKTLKKLVAFPVVLGTAMTAIHIFTFLGLPKCGVTPRAMEGATCIPFASLFHGNWEHLLSNLPSLMILAAILGFQTLNLGKAVTMTALGTLMGWSIVWMVGGTGTHLGASLTVYSLLGTVIAYGVFVKTGIWKKVWMILCGMGALFMHWGLLMALGSLVPGVSWSAHAFGLVGGLLAGWLTAQLEKEEPKKFGS